VIPCAEKEAIAEPESGDGFWFLVVEDL